MPDSAAPALAANVVADVIDNGQVSRQQVLVVGLCMFFNMLDGFDITAMAIVASAVSDELQLTADRLGLIFSFALAGMMAGAMLLAPLSDIIPASIMRSRHQLSSCRPSGHHRNRARRCESGLHELERRAR